MPGLEDLLGFVFRAVEVAPAYEPRRCLVVTRGTEEACSVCVDVCPHDAVSVRSGRVVIDPVDCTGCGLCVTACPSYALELPPPAPTEGPVRCSKVAGTARSVACLARLSPSDVLAATGASGEATLARGDCATCRLGGESVPEAVDRVVGMAMNFEKEAVPCTAGPNASP